MKAYRLASQPHYSPSGPSVCPGYLRYLRGQLCLVCGRNWGIEPHHTGSKALGRKASDFDAIPLCRIHHDEYHQGKQAFLEKYSLNLDRAIRQLQNRAEACGVDLTAVVPRKKPGRYGSFSNRRRA